MENKDELRREEEKKNPVGKGAKENQRENQRQEIHLSGPRISPRNSAEGVTNITMSFPVFYIDVFSRF